ncbi:hypothetical protein HY024_00750 [Candidatus Curtissbacteria bacterium]|nr:hypothetical protein [Candidatus Curtissbacteria bacterium]
MAYSLSFQFFARILAIALILGLFIYLFLVPIKSNTGPLSLVAHNINAQQMIDRASELVAQHKYNEAQETLLIVLQFEPKNIYANDLLAKLIATSQQTQKDILRVGVVTIKRPDYKAAWEKLANLYEITGDLENARIARETANGLKVI